MEYNKTSSQVILANIHRTFKPNNTGWLDDGIEWIGEGIQGIGKNIGMTIKTTPDDDLIKVKNYRAEYPCGLEALLGVEYKGMRLSLGADSSSCGIVRGNSNRFNGRGNTDYFNTNDFGLEFPFETGEVKLIYIVFPTDEEGFPLIIDTFKYKKAIEWYVMSQMILGGYKHHDNTIDYKFANEMWEDFAYKAQNEIKMPSIDRMERFARMWTSIKLDRTAYDRFFVNAENASYIGTTTDRLIG